MFFSYVHYFYTQLPIGIVIKLSYCFKPVLIIAAHRTIGSQFHDYGYHQCHRMRQFRVLSALASVNVINMCDYDNS